MVLSGEPGEPFFGFEAAGGFDVGEKAFAHFVALEEDGEGFAGDVEVETGDFEGGLGAAEGEEVFVDAEGDAAAGGLNLSAQAGGFALKTSRRRRAAPTARSRRLSWTAW